MTICEHNEFQADVAVARLSRDKGGPITSYVAEVKIHCAQCGKRFQFLGLEPGLDVQGARVSLDGLEAQLGLLPEGLKPNPLHRIAYGIGRNFDG